MRNRWIVLLAWLAVAAALAFFARQAGTQTTDDLTLPGRDSQRATDLLQDRFPSQANAANPVVYETKSGTVTDSSVSQAIEASVSSLEKESGVAQVVSPLTPEGETAVSKDGRIAYASVTLNDSPAVLTLDEARRIVAAADPSTTKRAGLDVAVGGYLGQKVSKPSTHDSETIGLIAAVIVLLFAFGTVVAMGMPIVTAIVGLVSGLSIIGLLGHLVEVPTISPTLATMIGLGVGIDYALFVVTRHRAALKRRMRPPEAAARAVATAGGAVVFAGTTVVIALCSLSVAGIPLVRTLGFTAAIAVLVAVLAAITLLPALLAIAGPRINSLRIPVGGEPAHDRKPHGWQRWAREVAKRPLPAMLVSVVLLVGLALPTLDLRLGQQDNGALPKSTETRRSYDLLTKGFGVGQNGPLLVSVRVKDQSDAPALASLRDAIAKTDGVKAVSEPEVNKQQTAAILNAIADGAPSSQATENTVNRLRDDVIPQATKGTGLRAFVGGQTASYIDLADEISEKLPWVIAAVIGLSFLVLLFAFRSIVVPITAGLMNLLSVGAAYGVVTAIFQKGWGASLIGLDGSVPVVSYLPLMMFAILFGLSMDYQVFLLTQVREEYQRTGDNRKAVVAGLAYSGRVITSAAMIMVAVFLSFVLNGDPTVKQFGVGMAAAIAVDATIVRCLLVPAIMILTGSANWWLPGWLERALPRLDIEGAHYFRGRRRRIA